MDRLAGPRSDDRRAGAAPRRALERRDRQRLLEVLDPALLGRSIGSSNFWNLPRLARLFARSRAALRRSIGGAVAVLALYVALASARAGRRCCALAGAGLLSPSSSKTCCSSASTRTSRWTSARRTRARRIAAIEQERSRDRCGCPRGSRRCSCISTRTSCTTCIRSCPAIACGGSRTRRRTRSAGGNGSRGARRPRRGVPLSEPPRHGVRPVTPDASIRVACALFLVAAFVLAGVRAGGWLASPRRAGSRGRSTAAARSAAAALLRRQQDRARIRRDGAGHAALAFCRCSRSPRLRPPDVAADALATPRSARWPARLHGRRAAQLVRQAAARTSRPGIAGHRCRGRGRCSSSSIGSTRRSACWPRSTLAVPIRCATVVYVLLVGRSSTAPSAC